MNSSGGRLVVVEDPSAGRARKRAQIRFVVPVLVLAVGSLSARATVRGSFLNLAWISVIAAAAACVLAVCFFFYSRAIASLREVLGDAIGVQVSWDDLAPFRVSGSEPPQGLPKYHLTIERQGLLAVVEGRWIVVWPQSLWYSEMTAMLDDAVQMTVFVKANSVVEVEFRRGDVSRCRGFGSLPADLMHLHSK